MKKILLPFLGFLVFLISCNESTTNNTNLILPGDDDQRTVQTALINAEPGDTIFFGEGVFKFNNSLTLEGVDSVTLLGKGMDKTIFDFSEQTDGAEGVKIMANHFTIQDLAILDVKGDGIKVQAAYGVTFRRLRVEWTADGDSMNGAYGIYPVFCKNVLMEECIARGAADAGIYVGQSENAIVRNNLVERNVAGIEVENTINAEVYGNTVRNNTGGILIFDLPDLPKKNGKNIRVYKNLVEDNNHFNFSPLGISVSLVPPGVGLMFMATQYVDAFDNEVKNNNTVGCAVLNLDMMGRQTEDAEYSKYPSAINIYNNNFTRAAVAPDTSRDLGKMLFNTFGNNIPMILFDGFENPDLMVNGVMPAEYKICLNNNTGASFFNLATQNSDASQHNCELASIPPTEFVWDGVKPVYIPFKPEEIGQTPQM